MKSFSAGGSLPAARSNAQIAQDFLDLTFQMESGRELPRLTKFIGSVKVGVRPGAPASLERELTQLLARLRREANIPISRASGGQKAQIYVEAIPRRTLQRAVPNAACFVVPNVTSWSEFKKYRKRSTTEWARLDKRTQALVVIPSDVSPQEVRDCLHEEIAQALGPLNDLYRLPDSIFNDDNFHTVLTGFDMVILKAFYSRELYNGITRSEAARVLPGVLARINPRGNGGGRTPHGTTPAEWSRAISGALGLNVNPSQRTRFANRALHIARERGWRDNRLAFSYFVRGRVSLAADSEVAIASFLKAGSLYKSLYGPSVHAAHVATQMSAFALSAGQFQTAATIVNEALPAARKSQNAALLATLLMIKSEALQHGGRDKEARAVRLDALGWARYGFGSEQNVRARLAEIQSLTPAKRS